MGSSAANNFTRPSEPSPARPPARTEGWTKKGPGEGFLSRGKNVSGMFPGTGPESSPNGGGIGVLWHHVMWHKTIDFIGFFVARPAGLEPATPGLEGRFMGIDSIGLTNRKTNALNAQDTLGTRLAHAEDTLGTRSDFELF